ncbi:MRG-domain-containing protein [Amylocarpus encephaloides]|uniref:Chromatin modification-related protein EAF3 n=1 Tax=Amylocarpus encephaloides TaxID=45428 RepID=A0A9P8C371_9HELO|nr:MRG-domain-containing protein [Amylocarpus encephaloides]
MAPSKTAEPTSPFAVGERTLCFHHDMLYEAKVLDVRMSGPNVWEYKIHYKGWKNTWDDWVPGDRVRKFTDENKELAAQLHNQQRLLQRGSKSISKGNKKPNGSDFSSVRGSEERHTSVAAPGGRGGQRRNREYDLENEENFHARPSIRLVVPDHIKAILVDDWENVTKSQQLIPLPAAHTVSAIVDDYMAFEAPKRQVGSAQEHILEEVVAGLKDYFEKCLGRILLYRFERHQYTEVREAWASSNGDLAGKTACDTYGAEHLCRLLVTLPELIAQTNMDAQSVNRLREELSKMTNWLGRNAEKYFVKEYETPSQEYVDKARSV